MSSSNISLPLNFNQVFELVRQLSSKEKEKLAKLINEDLEQNISIPEEHKNIVRSRIKKYKAHPEMLVDWKKAQKTIRTS